MTPPEGIVGVAVGTIANVAVGVDAIRCRVGGIVEEKPHPKPNAKTASQTVGSNHWRRVHERRGR
jgi:hypothetical protein